MKYALLVLVGCGGGATELRTSVTLPASIAESAVGSLDFLVLTDIGKDGAHLSCSTPIDWSSQGNVLYHRFAARGDLHFVGVPSGKSLIVVVNAFTDASGLGLPIASGCTEGVTVTAGRAQTVALQLSGSR